MLADPNLVFYRDSCAAFAAPLDKGHLFQAKYVPFKAVMEGDPWKSEESYSLDEVIYR